MNKKLSVTLTLFSLVALDRLAMRVVIVASLL